MIGARLPCRRLILVDHRVAPRCWDARTDVFFTSDHGEFQGELGPPYKGPYHCDALMRVPLIWHPAPTAAIAGVAMCSRNMTAAFPRSART
jgi:hypothetical protein